MRLYVIVTSWGRFITPAVHKDIEKGKTRIDVEYENLITTRYQNLEIAKRDYRLLLEEFPALNECNTLLIEISPRFELYATRYSAVVYDAAKSFNETSPWRYRNVLLPYDSGLGANEKTARAFMGTLKFKKIIKEKEGISFILDESVTAKEVLDDWKTKIEKRRVCLNRYNDWCEQ